MMLPPPAPLPAPGGAAVTRRWISAALGRARGSSPRVVLPSHLIKSLNVNSFTEKHF